MERPPWEILIRRTCRSEGHIVAVEASSFSPLEKPCRAILDAFENQGI